jgi:hypothetical protein
MKDLESKPLRPHKFSPVVLSLLFAFSLEVLDGAATAIGQPVEYRMVSALVSVAVLMLLGLAIYGVHHRARWGNWLAVGIACVTLGFSVPTLLVGNLTINGVRVDQTPLSQGIGWTKMAAYGLFLFVLVRERLTSTAGAQ